MGRYLTYLFYFGQEWLKAQMDALFPSDDDSLRRAAWLSHLWHDQHPSGNLMPELRPCYADEIARLTSDQHEHDLEFRQDRLADNLIILHFHGKLPGDLIEQFWQTAPLRLRQHAMWFLGTVLASPTLPNEMRTRGRSYWEHRLATAKNSTDPDSFRPELGAIGDWSLRDQVDDLWLLDQMIAMLNAGFFPTNAFSVVEWLADISSQYVDRAVEVLAAFLTNPRMDQWAYMTQQDAIRTVLSEGLANGTRDTIEKVHEVISFLSSMGETGYLNLIPPSAPA